MTVGGWRGAWRYATAFVALLCYEEDLIVFVFLLVLHFFIARHAVVLHGLHDAGAIIVF